MKINRIVNKGAKDIIIHCDDDEFLILALEVFLKSGLKKNDELSDERFSFLIRENRLYHIKQRAFRYLDRRLHSASELRTKLRQKGYEIEMIDQVMSELKDKSYLDDSEFASVFVEEKFRSKMWSENKLKGELIKRGVKSSIISEVLRNKFSKEVNYNNALTVALKKYKILQERNLDLLTTKKKLISFLSTRGYNYEIIKQVCDKLIAD
jgi:regulatory protein